VAKITAQISRAEPEAPPAHPFDEISVDMHPLQGHRIYTRYLLITCRDTGFTMPYMLITDNARSILEAMIDAYCYTRVQFKTRWRKVRSDNELMADIIQTWFRAHGIRYEPSAPNTQSQNGLAERSGGVIGEMTRTMRIHANLPEEHWPKNIEAACYIDSQLRKHHTYHIFGRIRWRGRAGVWTCGAQHHPRQFLCRRMTGKQDIASRLSSMDANEAVGRPIAKLEPSDLLIKDLPPPPKN
jgi:hypothetical protein